MDCVALQSSSFHESTADLVMIRCGGAKLMVIMRNCAIKLTIVKVQIALQFSLFTLVLYKCTLCIVQFSVQVYIVQLAL